MKSHSYMTRAMQSRDPRFSRILGKLGYGGPTVGGESVQNSATNADEAGEAGDQLVSLRAEYHAMVGKRPFHGWDAEDLRARIEDAKTAV